MKTTECSWDIPPWALDYLMNGDLPYDDDDERAVLAFEQKTLDLIKTVGGSRGSFTVGAVENEFSSYNDVDNLAGPTIEIVFTIFFKE